MLSFQNKKVIIFDLDGTIVNLNNEWSKVKKYLSIKFSEIYKTDDNIFNRLSHYLDKAVEKGDNATLKEFFKIISNFEVNNIHSNDIIEETVFFIKNREKFGLKNDIKLAIFSLNSRYCIKESLNEIELLEEFDFIIGREDVRKWKPDPEGLLNIIEHYNFEKDKFIYLGDSKYDLDAGMNAGIDTFLIDDIITLVSEKTR